MGKKFSLIILKTELILHDDSDQPIVLDEPESIANAIGRRFEFVSSKN